MFQLKHLFYGFSVVFLLADCNKLNFEETITSVDEFTPSVSNLPQGTWELIIQGTDTTVFQADSIYCDQIGTRVGFVPYGINTNPPGSSFTINFFSATNPVALAIGSYPLEELIEFDLQTWQGGGAAYDTLNVWTNNQLDATVEIISSEIKIEPFFQTEINEISGFIIGTLTDDNGHERQIQSAFNKIIRYKL